MGRLSQKTTKSMKTFSLLLMVSLVVFAATTDIVFSKGGDHERAKRLREMGDILPLSQILDKVQKDYGGQIIEVELEEEHGVVIYELEVLDGQGVVWELKYDAKSGTLLKVEEDD